MNAAAMFDSVPDPPCFWTNEVSGVLRPAVVNYLNGRRLSIEELGAMKAYMRQWIFSSVWDLNPHGTEENEKELAAARRLVAGIQNADDLRQAMRVLVDLGLDPL